LWVVADKNKGCLASYDGAGRYALVIGPSPWRSPRLLALFALSAVLTTTLQVWVGLHTYYDTDQVRVQQLHDAIVAAQPPAEKRWEDFGANGTALRRLAVLSVDAVHDASGVALKWVYFAQDSACLFLFFPLLFALLCRVAHPSVALIGVLYTSTVLVTTYHFGWFHPWDRPSQLVWVLALHAVLASRPAAFAGLLVVGMLIKYDMLLLPLAWPVARSERVGWRRALIEAAAFFAVGLSIYVGLRLALPGSIEKPHGSAGARSLFFLRELGGSLLRQGPTLPPLLMIGMPMALALVGFRRLGQGLRGFVVVALLMWSIYALRSHFHESRAQVPVLLLTLPAAALWVGHLLGLERRPAG
jgi:hypothetical protein